MGCTSTRRHTVKTIVTIVNSILGCNGDGDGPFPWQTLGKLNLKYCKATKAAVKLASLDNRSV